MTIQDAIKGMVDFYRAVEKVYADLPVEVKKQFDNCFTEANDAMDELEKMQTVGIDCKHCKFSGLENACKVCMFYRLTPTDQKRPLNYEPI